MNSFKTDWKDLFSIVIISETCPMIAENVPANTYWLPLQNAFSGDTFRIELIQKCAGTEGTGTTGIDTPWIVFLESGEYLAKEDMRALSEYCRENTPSPTRLAVKRFISTETMSRFSWVTTAFHMNRAVEGLRTYSTLEFRLFPVEMFRSLRASPPQPGGPVQWAITFDQAGSSDTRTCPAVISRAESGERPDKDERPSDRDIFRHGHEKYFDDRIFSARFEWPHTSYHTILYHHVPSIIEALRQGLSNPRIATYTLIYLLRFRHFKEALEMVRWIPEHWYARYPDLTNGVAAFYYINGEPDKALAMYNKILIGFPDANWIARNVIKLNILTGKYDAIDRIFRNYRKATGEDLKDSYYEEFTYVHGEHPLRTATLSVCLIVKDEERTLSRALKSIQPMADEIIVVDTGSSDNSVSIAESFGARVFRYAWCDDFSAARNFAISQASCDYIFMLDADEYISPLFFIESQTLKKLFPLREKRAFSIPVGSYLNDIDWLFVIQEEGNFRPESFSVRIFPREAGPAYSGRIVESIEPALAEKRIPVQNLAKGVLHIVHDRIDRKARIERKVPIYAKLEAPGAEAILTAIRDFSFIGRSAETVQWLTSFYRHHVDRTVAMKMGLHLAGILAASDSEQADHLYRELLRDDPENRGVLLEYAAFLMINNRIQEIAHLHLPDLQTSNDDDLELSCFLSLKHFEAGDTENAFALLTEALDANPYSTFPQALRLYFLASMNDVEGFVATMDAIFTLLGIGRDFTIERLGDVFSLAEELYAAMLKGPYRKEQSLLLYGMSKLGIHLGVK